MENATKNDNLNPHESISQSLKKWQIILGLFVISSWILLFTCGLLINSEPYRNIIIGQNNDQNSLNLTVEKIHQPTLLKSWCMVIISYTPINLLLLAMLAGIIGAISRMAGLHTTKKRQIEIPSDKSNPIVSGIFRGLFVYLLFLSGILIINEAPLISPTQIEYARLSGIMSLFCFILSYDPSKFRSFLDRGVKTNDDNTGK